MEILTRRKFLRKSMLVTSGSLLVPQFLNAFQSIKGDNHDRILVVLQLSGGNDGLNTVVPYRNDAYYRARPSLGIAANSVNKVSDELGFNAALKLKEVYDQGLLTIINNVGYPNPDRSHFRSMDIWQTGSGSSQHLSTGWIGRYLDSNCDQCSSHTAVEVDDSLGLALRGERVKGMAIRNPEKLYRATQGPMIRKMAGEHGDEPTLEYLYKTLAETVSNAAYIYNSASVTRSTFTYPNTEFGKRLKTISELIQSGIQTKVYYASLSGFDTHVRQAGQQERLLGIYSEAVSALTEDLKAAGQLDRTLIMTFSEFGRRVEENASGGTDHGTANNLFLIGGKLKTPGFFNTTPDLGRLDQGDLIHDIDFRQVYASILRNWLKADDAAILGDTFPMLDLA